MIEGLSSLFGFNSHQMIEPPLDSIRLLNLHTHQPCEAKIVELSRFMAFRRVSYEWWRFYDHGPFADKEKYREPEDRHWRWVSIVRRLRKNPLSVRAAVQTSDLHVQGATIYRLNGISYLEPGEGAIFGEFLATAPRNRETYVKNPLYRGVGGGLMIMMMLHSFLMGFKGRVNLHALPQSVEFHEKYGFLKTTDENDRKILYEARSDHALRLLQEAGLI